MSSSTRKTTSISRDVLILPDDSGTLNAGPFFDGFDLQTVLNQRFNCTGFFATTTPACVPAAGGRPNQLYSLVDQFRGPRSARFYIRFAF